MPKRGKEFFFRPLRLKKRREDTLVIFVAQHNNGIYQLDACLFLNMIWNHNRHVGLV